MAFKTSINIKFDIGNQEFIKSYLPTPSHADVLKGLLNGFNQNGNRSHIIIGPYGTGKSLITTVISSIVSKKIEKDIINILISKLQKVDDYIADQIIAISNLNRRYIPIALTGNEGCFRQSILSSIVKKLRQEGIDIVLPGLGEKIIESIDIWKDKFPDAFKEFLLLLEKDSKDYQDWIKLIKNHNEDEIKYFSDIYSIVNRGASFNIDYKVNFLEQMVYISDILEDNNLGILIIYDEFGRFLQGLNRSKFNETMQDIQDLAELTERKENMQLILITHKSLRQYFGSYYEEAVDEFQRIEKRFRQYYIRSDQATFLRVAESILTENVNNKPKISPSLAEETKNQLMKYPLFPSLNKTERDKIVIEAMYPLHPVSLFILPHLTRVFGQNERTLFTFLESEETGGLLYHMKKTNDFYKAHQLFDYFFPDTSGISMDKVISEYFMLYRKALARIPNTIKNKSIIIDIIKFLTIWNATNLQSEQKLTDDFLEFSMQLDPELLKNILLILNENKIARFNRINGYWELFAGSSIDIYDIIEKEQRFLDISDNNIYEVLYKNLDKKYYFPEKYNDEKGMTRFAKVKLVLDNDNLLANDIIDFIQQNESDITIFYVIPSNDKLKDYRINYFKEITHKYENIIFAIHPESFTKIKEKIKHSLILDKLKNDINLINQDVAIKEEIEIISLETSYAISEYLSILSKFDHTIKWIYNGEEKSINEEIELTNLLNIKCYSLFGLTPVILNDSFNRINISKQQKKAAIQVVNNIIDKYRDEYFGITGNGPDYAIFASIFKNNERLDIDINELNYNNIKIKSFKELRKKIIEMLNTNPKGQFQDIISIFTNPPFGIRRSIIPILLVALIRDRWNDFMLYYKDMYVPGLNGEKLYRIMDEEELNNYNYFYVSIEEKYIEFFYKIENEFYAFLESRLEGKSRLILVCGTLIKWLRSLPRFVQLTQKYIDDDYIWLRETIKRTEVNPQESIKLLFDKFNYNFNELIKIKRYVEQYIMLFKDNLINEVLKLINVSNKEELFEWAGLQDEYVKKNNKLINSLVQISSDNWLDSFVENYIGVRIEDWSDTTYEFFLKQLKNDLLEINNHRKNFDNLDEKEFLFITIRDKRMVIPKLDLSVKAQTINSNIERIINNASRNISRQEVEYIIYQLIEKYID